MRPIDPSLNNKVQVALLILRYWSKMELLAELSRTVDFFVSIVDKFSAYMDQAQLFQKTKHASLS